MLDQAKKKIATLGLTNTKLIESDVESIDFPTQSFDIIFCCSGIVFIPDI